MRAGFSKQCITPRNGTLMEGLSQRSPAQSIHDDLFVRALFLNHDGVEQVILSFDLLFLDRGQVDRIKGAVGNVTGLCPAQILINFTHTHCSPRVTSWAYTGQIEEAYMNLVEAQAIGAVLGARESLRDVTLEAGTTTTDLPVNRRLPDANGVAQWKPNFAGPVINDLPCCVLRDLERGDVISVLFSVACHPSMIYEFAISAEFPGAAVRHLNKHFATEGSLFLQGAAGDAKPRPGAGDGSRWVPCTWEQMEEVGAELAAKVIECSTTMARIEPSLTAGLIEVPWHQEQTPRLEDLQKVIGSTSEPVNRKAWATDMLAILELRGGLIRNPGILVHFIELGAGLRIVAIEGEVLARLGKRLMAEIPDGVTFLLGYSNGTAIYLPDRDDVTAGGYEVDSFWEYHKASAPAPDCDGPLVDSVHAHFSS